MAYFVYILGLVLFYLMHSLLATKRIKAFLSSILSRAHYRIFYNLVSLCALCILLLFYASNPHSNLIEQLPFKILGIILLLAGIWILKRCLPLYDWHEFLGLSHSENPKLVRYGLASQVRHPLYLGSLVFLSGLSLFDFNLWSISSLLITIGYVYVGIFFEEKKLVEQFGESYRKYQGEVPKLFPRFFSDFQK